MPHLPLHGLTSSLRDAGDPARAAKAAAYLKSDLAFFGVRLPVVRALVKQAYRCVEGRDEALALATALWDDVPVVFEQRMAAVLVLVEAVPLLARADLELVVRFVRESHTWALVDGLACDVAGPVVERLEAGGDDLTPWLDALAVDTNFWVRRTALLAHLRPLVHTRAGRQAGDLTSSGDWARFARYADAMLDEKEFFIRKAIGWILRDTSKRRPELVRSWVEPRTGRMSGVTRREAVKYL